MDSSQTTRNETNGSKLTLDQVRAKLDGKSGKRYWRSLDELAETTNSATCCSANSRASRANGSIPSPAAAS